MHSHSPKLRCVRSSPSRAGTNAKLLPPSHLPPPVHFLSLPPSLTAPPKKERGECGCGDGVCIYFTKINHHLQAILRLDPYKQRVRLMDECPGDSSVSASPGGPPWRPRRQHFQLPFSNSLPSQPRFTLCCLSVRRAPGHRKRRFPECPGLETITASVLNIFRGKRCANSSLRGASHRPLEGVYPSRESSSL